MQSLRGIVNSYSLHYNVKIQASIMSSKMKTNLNGKEGSDLVNNDNAFLFILSTCLHMPLYANFLGVIVHICALKENIAHYY